MRYALTALLMVSCSACSLDRGEPLANQIDDLHGDVQTLRVEVAEHAAAAEAAIDLPALRSRESDHGYAMEGHMNELDHVIGDMHMCDGAPDHDLDTMDGLHDMCASEVQRHALAIETTANLETARDEERAHHHTMMRWLDELDARDEVLMDGHGTMMCDGHQGIHDHHGRP